jgi:hypothetical protein
MSKRTTRAPMPKGGVTYIHEIYGEGTEQGVGPYTEAQLPELDDAIAEITKAMDDVFDGIVEKIRLAALRGAEEILRSALATERQWHYGIPFLLGERDGEPDEIEFTINLGECQGQGPLASISLRRLAESLPEYFDDFVGAPPEKAALVGRAFLDCAVVVHDWLVEKADGNEAEIARLRGIMYGEGEEPTETLQTPGVA